MRPLHLIRPLVRRSNRLELDRVAVDRIDLRVSGRIVDRHQAHERRGLRQTQQTVGYLVSVSPCAQEALAGLWTTLQGNDFM